jgi:t-SNARE complex subunit (syntaxin)
LKEAIAELREAVAQRDSAIATQREESVQQISRLESDILELKRLIDSLNSTHAAELQQQAALASLRNAEVRKNCCFFFCFLGSCMISSMLPTL